MSIVIAFLLVLSCGSAADGASPLALPTVDVIQTAAVEMDVYSTRSDGKVPIVVLLHGGTTEGRIQLEPLARTLSQRDLLVFVPQWDAIPDLEVFREDPGAALLGQTVDVVCAVRQARVSAPALGGDPDQLVLVADSQAGAVALRTALSPGAAWPEADCNPTIDHVPDSFVGLAGNYSGSQYRNLITPIELWDRFDPLRFVGSDNDLPIILVHSLGDSSVTPQQSVKLDRLLSERGHDSTLFETDNGHAGVIRPDTSTGMFTADLIEETAHVVAATTLAVGHVLVGFGEDGCTADLTAQIDNHTAFTVGFTNDSETTAWLLVFEATRAGAPLPETGSSEGQHFSTHTPFLSHVAFREADPGVDVMATLAISELDDWIVACAVPDETGIGFTIFPELHLGSP